MDLLLALLGLAAWGFVLRWIGKRHDEYVDDVLGIR